MSVKKQEIEILGKKKMVSIYECELCDFKCISDKSKLDKHLKSVKHIRKVNPPDNNPESEKHRSTDIVHCEYCNIDCKLIYYNGYHSKSIKHKKNVYLKKEAENEKINLK